jgi:hypothetical protein
LHGCVRTLISQARVLGAEVQQEPGLGWPSLFCVHGTKRQLVASCRYLWSSFFSENTLWWTFSQKQNKKKKGSDAQIKGLFAVCWSFKTHLQIHFLKPTPVQPWTWHWMRHPTSIQEPSSCGHSSFTFMYSELRLSNWQHQGRVLRIHWWRSWGWGWGEGGGEGRQGWEGRPPPCSINYEPNRKYDGISSFLSEQHFKCYSCQSGVQWSDMDEQICEYLSWYKIQKTNPKLSSQVNASPVQGYSPLLSSIFLRKLKCNFLCNVKLHIQIL